MNDILTGYNLYKKHESAIDKQQTKSKEISDTQNETVKRLETVIGRIEDVQGVKAPKRPPFPSWACLAFLFWHWPMYGFAFLWQSKYFRRFCFLTAFFVMVLEFCIIVLLSYDNKDLHRDRAKYVTVRNWSLVEGDTATINKFDYVDFIYSDVKYRKDDIDALHETIRKKYDVMMENKQKQQNFNRYVHAYYSDNAEIMMELEGIDMMFADQKSMIMPVKEYREYMKERKRGAKGGKLK